MVSLCGNNATINERVCAQKPGQALYKSVHFSVFSSFVYFFALGERENIFSPQFFFIETHSPVY